MGPQGHASSPAARPKLSFGSRGSNVSLLQQRLNEIGGSRLPQLKVDGIFGPKTLARVKEFQSANGLKPDGIVGPLTWAALTPAPPPVPPTSAPRCANSEPGIEGLRTLVTQRFLAEINAPVQTPRQSFAAHGGIAEKSVTGSGVGSMAGLTSGLLGAIGQSMGQHGANPPGAAHSFAPGVHGASALFSSVLKSFRPLTPAQISTAKSVYGSSIDYSMVFLSLLTGAYNRPFTAAVPMPGPIPLVAWVLNVGTFTPSDHVLIHELAHVWQSQHDTDKMRYIGASISCQGAVLAYNQAAAVADPSVKAHKDFPTDYPASAYSYKPGGSFFEYGVEQIAQQVEDGVASIRKHVASLAPHAVDPQNIASLLRISFADRRNPGVV